MIAGRVARAPQDVRHRANQCRWLLQRQARLIGTERLDPAGARLELEDAAHVVADADQQHAEDQRIQRRVVLEGAPNHVVKQPGDDRREQQKDEDAVQEALRIGHQATVRPSGW